MYGGWGKQFKEEKGRIFGIISPTAFLGECRGVWVCGGVYGGMYG